MTEPDMATILRQIKVPEQMKGSQALRDFLLVYVDDEESLATPERLKQLNGLLLLSHLEVVNTLGALEERAATQHVEKFRDDIKKYRKRRWF